MKLKAINHNGEVEYTEYKDPYYLTVYVMSGDEVLHITDKDDKNRKIFDPFYKEGCNRYFNIAYSLVGKKQIKEWMERRCLSVKPGGIHYE